MPESNDGQTALDQELKSDEEASRKRFKDAYEFLASVPNAPKKADVQQWKNSTPNQRLRIFSPDGKRVYIVRAVGGLEMQKLERMVPENMAAEKAEMEKQLAVVSACVLWTNTTADHKITMEQLRAGSAGLPVTLFQLIAFVSDFMDPSAFDIYSAEL